MTIEIAQLAVPNINDDAIRRWCKSAKRGDRIVFQVAGKVSRYDVCNLESNIRQELDGLSINLEINPVKTIPDYLTVIEALCVTPGLSVCWNCGAEAKCNGDDVGAVEYEDYFVVWCDACGRIEATSQRGGDCMGSIINQCPYCKVRASSHGFDMPERIRERTKGWPTGVLVWGSPIRLK